MSKRKRRDAAGRGQGASNWGQSKKTREDPHAFKRDLRNGVQIISRALDFISRSFASLPPLECLDIATIPHADLAPMTTLLESLLLHRRSTTQAQQLQALKSLWQVVQALMGALHEFHLSEEQRGQLLLAYKLLANSAKSGAEDTRLEAVRIVAIALEEREDVRAALLIRHARRIAGRPQYAFSTPADLLRRVKALTKFTLEINSKLGFMRRYIESSQD